MVESNEIGGRDGVVVPDSRGKKLGGAASSLNMLALPALVLTPIIRLRQRAAAIPRTLRRRIITMVPSTPPNGSGRVDATARERKSDGRSRGVKGTRGGRNSGRGRGNWQGGSAEDI